MRRPGTRHPEAGWCSADPGILSARILKAQRRNGCEDPSPRHERHPGIRVMCPDACIMSERTLQGWAERSSAGVRFASKPRVRDASHASSLLYIRRCWGRPPERVVRADRVPSGTRLGRGQGGKDNQPSALRGMRVGAGNASTPVPGLEKRKMHHTSEPATEPGSQSGLRPAGLATRTSLPHPHTVKPSWGS